VLVDRVADYGGFDRRGRGGLSKGESMIDLTKPVQTRDGRDVRIWMPDAGGDRPVHGSIYDVINDKWMLASWLPSGLHCGNDDCRDRLVNVFPKMIKRRMYVSTWGKDSGKASVNPINGLDSNDLTALNFPFDIEIPEGYGL